jgi:predicted ATPase
MTITLNGRIKTPENFFLENEITIDDQTIVLTGINGSGKTRLLDSIVTVHDRTNNYGYTFIERDGHTLQISKIKKIHMGNSRSNFGAEYDSLHHDKILQEKIKFYQQYKNEIHLNENGDFFKSIKIKQIKNDKTHPNRGVNQFNPANPIDLVSTYHEIKNIIDDSNNFLDDMDIILKLEEKNYDIFNPSEISIISNNYIRQKNTNLANIGLHQMGRKVNFIPENEFEDYLGERPWVVLNKILLYVFNEKFKLTEPDEEDYSYKYSAKLVLSNDENEIPISLSKLSSGESTLIWLVFTLFNIQYYNSHIKDSVPEILLFDEPDSKLHPKMVQKLYSIFKQFNEKFGTIIILTTHSPTTVALAPSEYIYHVADNNITKIDKDTAITELLDGINQIAINPKNRRQVFVESHNDALLYTELYSFFLKRSTNIKNTKIDPSISINFVPSGPKLNPNHLRTMIKTHLGKFEENQIEKFLAGTLGNGSCEQVKAQVENLQPTANESVRGIIDWDGKAKSTKSLAVLAEGYAYTIENITLDPLAILLLLHCDDKIEDEKEQFLMTEICGEDVDYITWMERKDLLQNSINYFIKEVLGHDNNEDADLSYITGLTLKTDKRYLEMRAHENSGLEEKVLSRFQPLKRYLQTNLSFSIVKKSMIKLSGGKFIPQAFEDVITTVQK